MPKPQTPTKLTQAINAALENRLGGRRTFLDGPKISTPNCQLTAPPNNTTKGEGKCA